MADISIDPLHKSVDFARDPLIADVTRDKYLQVGEDFFSMCTRVSQAILPHNPKLNLKKGDIDYNENCYQLMSEGIWMPAGRILSGAGTQKEVTLMNCFVNQTVEDSMRGILDANAKAGITLQHSGGIGTNFSTIRPYKAQLKRTGAGSRASGPIPFMHMINQTSLTVRSAGDRRGAMMGTLSDTHPDLPAFIVAKKEKGVLEQFNISILVSDAFMDSVAMDEDWLLHFHIPPIGERNQILQDYDFDDANGVRQYVYSIWKARDLWDLITRNTYDYSEPGIIFIDRVNDLNNLNYCELISCTNPCGEQPLPPDGTCNLGAINLLRVVREPFSRHAEIDFGLIELAARTGVRFLDNVIEATKYPFVEQRNEEYNKRRIGLGVSGLADMFIQLQVRYGSARSASIAEAVMQRIATVAYEESALLAHEKGCFPLFDKDEYMRAPFIQKLPDHLQQMIGDLGIRNGVLLTIAPTGTTSITFGNGSSGLEPNFAFPDYNRKVHQADDTFKMYENVEPYVIKLYKEARGIEGPVDVDMLPEYMVTAQDISIDDHLRVQAACQKWVDASVSKTINIPTDTPYEEFTEVYAKAYQMGCKGCTTYRYSEVRGSILSVGQLEGNGPNPDYLRPRPDVLHGTTYKIKWPSWSASLYVIINNDETGRPFEIFIQSKDARHQEWITALTLMISAIFRKQGDITFIPDELRQIQSTHDGRFANEKFYPSLVARIADVIEGHIHRNDPKNSPIPPAVEKKKLDLPTGLLGEPCPTCAAPAMIRQEGCKVCTSCGFSTCG